MSNNTDMFKEKTSKSGNINLPPNEIRVTSKGRLSNYSKYALSILSGTEEDANSKYSVS